MSELKTCPFCAEQILAAAIVCKHCGRDWANPSQAAQSKRTSKRSFLEIALLVVCVAAISVASLMFVSDAIGTHGSSQMPPPLEPMTITDQVQNVPAASWKAVPLTVPYAGTVEVSLSVVNGNPLDVFISDADQLDTMKQGEWRDVQTYSSFSATKTKAFRRSARLDRGHYYLVMRDTSLGILSERASDVEVKARVRP